MNSTGNTQILLTKSPK